MASSIFDSPEHPAAASVATILLLAYQQVHMARDAALACLAQTGGPYDIIFSDDHSSDGTFAVLQQVAAEYRGPHRVTVRQSPRNVGIGQHYNDLVALARTELLVTMAADDLSVPDRVARLVAAWQATDQRADLIASHAVDMDEHGQRHGRINVDDLAQWQDLHRWYAQRPYVIGATHAFTRRMMQRFGPLTADLFYEDQIMVFRALAGGGALTVNEALVYYRRGGTSRRPDFDNLEQMRAWHLRQLRREQAEMEQLLADAELVRQTQTMTQHLNHNLLKNQYMQALYSSTSNAQRWRLAQTDYRGRLPWWWRTRKALHMIFPTATVHTKKIIKRLQAWVRHRNG